MREGERERKMRKTHGKLRDDMEGGGGGGRVQQEQIETEKTGGKEEMKDNVVNLCWTQTLVGTSGFDLQSKRCRKAFKQSHLHPS